MIVDNFFLVESGTVDTILTLPGLTRELGLPGHIIDFPLVLGSSSPNVTFNITTISGNNSTLLDPLVLPYSYGVVPTEPLGMEV